LAFPAGDLARHRIQSEISERHGDGFAVIIDLCAAQQSPHSGQQLFKREWLGQIVIGACVETGDPLGNRVAGGQHQDRQIVAGAAQLTAHLQAVQPRHHDVEHEPVGPIGSDHLQGFNAVFG
jgi:hypothetical protein